MAIQNTGVLINDCRGQCQPRYWGLGHSRKNVGNMVIGQIFFLGVACFHPCDNSKSCKESLAPRSSHICYDLDRFAKMEVSKTVVPPNHPNYHFRNETHGLGDPLF